MKEKVERNAAGSCYCSASTGKKMYCYAA